MTTDLDQVARLAVEDRRSARILADAERQRLAAEAARADADAAAERELRTAAAREQLAAQRRTNEHTHQGEIMAQRRAERAARATERAARRQARAAWVSARVDYCRHNAPAVYSAGIYGMAVAGAVYGQVTAATQRGWPLVVGLTAAAAIEGLALSMALTAHQLRLRGERALAPRALTWGCAAVAAGVNYAGHAHTDRAGAYLLALLSVAGITVWEIRSGAKHRQALREAGMIPEPPAQFGWRRWVRYPASTLGAWSRDVRDRVSPRAADLFEAAAVERAQREHELLRLQVARQARAAARKATRRGDAQAALDALVRLAQTGTVGDEQAPVPSLSGDGRSAGLARAYAREAVGSALVPTGPAGRPADGPYTDEAPGAGSLARVGAYARTYVSETAALTSQSSAGDRSGDAPVAAVEAATSLAHVRTYAREAVDRPAPAPAAVSGSVPAAAGRGGRTSATVRPPAEGTAAPARPTPDVSDLLPAGRTVRARLAAAGRSLTRDGLIAGLRADGHTVSSARASALLAALNTDRAATVADPA